MTHGPQAGGAGTVGLQPFLIGPEAGYRDVGRATIFQQDQAVLRLPQRAARPWATGHLPSRVDGPMTPAVVTGVKRMVQQILQGDTVGTMPFELAAVGTCVRPDRHTNAVLDQVTQQAMNRPEALELVEDQSDTP
jgi:hypothetical protein